MKNQHSNLRLLTWFNFFLDFRPYTVVAILYFQQITGSFALGMLISSITMIASAIFEITTGILSDRVGRKKTMMFGSMASICSIALYASGSIWWPIALIGGMCEGLASSFFSGNNDALLYDTLKENRLSCRSGPFCTALTPWLKIISCKKNSPIISGQR